MVMRRTVAMRFRAESEARAMRRTPRLRAVGSYVMYRMSGGARGRTVDPTTTARVGVLDVVAAGGAACSAAAESGAPSQRKRRSPVRNSRLGLLVHRERERAAAPPPRHRLAHGLGHPQRELRLAADEELDLERAAGEGALLRERQRA